MSQPARPGAGNSLLWASLALFFLFVLLACYHKYHDALNTRFFETRDASLLEELAQARIIEEPEPLSGGWPQWRGLRRDGVAFGQNTRFDWPNGGPDVLWKVDGGKGYSSLAVCVGRAFTMLRDRNNEVVVCLDVENKGERIWSFAYPCTFHNQYGDGPRSTPTLDREPCHALSAAAGPYARAASLLPGDRLYTVGADGMFHCLDAVTGQPFWKEPHELLKEFNATNLTWGVAWSPLIEGDLVIALPGGPNAAIVAFDKYTGEKKWAAQFDKAGYSSPLAVTAAGLRQILVLGGEALLSVSPQDGSLFWRYPWEVNADVNAATPTLFRAEKDGRVLDYVFISSGYAKGSALLKLGTNKEGKPNFQVVYKDHKVMRSQFSSPVRHGDYLYGFDDVLLSCINLKTGERQWDESGLFKGSLLRIDDRLIVLSENGKLALFPAAPKPTISDGSRALAVVDDVFGEGRPRTWTMPVLADGRLLLRDEKTIICFDLRK